MTLTEFFHEHPKVALGFSGGVDSSFLLWAGRQAGADIHPYYIKTAFQPEFEYQDALRLCRELGAELTVLELDALADPQVTANPANRCYFCKVGLFGTLSRRAADQVLGLAQSAGALRIPEGENAELSRTLWRACGVIAQGEFPRGMPRLTLAFAGAAGESPGVMADLGAGLPENAAQVWRPQPLPPRGAMERMPAGCDPGVFAAALLECGALRPREIRVSRLDIPGDTPYNNEIVKE